MSVSMCLDSSCKGIISVCAYTCLMIMIAFVCRGLTRINLADFMSRMEVSLLECFCLKKISLMCIELCFNYVSSVKEFVTNYARCAIGDCNIFCNRRPELNPDYGMKGSINNVKSNKGKEKVKTKILFSQLNTIKYSLFPFALCKEQTHNLEEFVVRLEEERLKIDAFKRELPLCMQLLNNGAKAPQEADINLALNGKQRINGARGAFLPFSSKDRAFPELALASSNKEEDIILEDHDQKMNNSSKGQVNGTTTTTTSNNTSNQNQRKARRCWSPELHRRFVNALHMLGGSQVATPKQIRELMKVDGLTNDEVKSHLQKYRLHTRRPSPSPQASVTAAPQVVFLGGIWVPPEYAAAAAAQGGAPAAALYGAHATTTHHVSPQQFCSAGAAAQPVPQEMYPPPPNHQIHHHPLHHQQFHLYNKTPITQRNSSPGSNIHGGGGGDPSDCIEDGKSESGSWKADSGGGDNGGDRRRVECEESNASVVTLKF
ncbi:hypothetical protein BUALT_Bualt18G0106100 [Buddleja alternifolia]|uniref:HTH myb-type domain-containing protein n=1 Tax=Buddleja alternifolia TaxID=168488 RepID=A0AAV6W9R8_9LAMI|nr:hypothetical protein BUALT_Bualt18G0106100 [Buddleja alternifolia]